MHTVWKGSISFGLVNIPIKMFTATESKGIKMKYLHKECKSPLKQKRMCPVCDKEVDWDDIVKGYEYEPGRYVLIEKEDIEKLKAETGHKAIEILDFVNLSEIDPIYFDKSYYLSPNETGGKAYNLLRQAMNDTGRIAIAKVTIRDKESLSAIRVYKNSLVMETIYYPDEVREVEKVPAIPKSTEVDKKELDMATQLIGNLTAEFNPEKYKDNYREALRELINKKVAGKEIETPKETPPSNVINLMDALQRSIKATEKDIPPKKKRGRKKKNVG